MIDEKLWFEKNYFLSGCSRDFFLLIKKLGLFSVFLYILAIYMDTIVREKPQYVKPRISIQAISEYFGKLNCATPRPTIVRSQKGKTYIGPLSKNVEEERIPPIA